MADKIDQITLNGTSYDIDLPPDATPSIASITTSGDITVGGNVFVDLSTSSLPNTYTELTYISSSGPQYINTGYKITSESMKIEFKCDFSGTSSINGMTLFGSNGSVYDLVPYHSDGYGTGVFQHWVGSSGGAFPVTYNMESPNIVEYTLNNGTISCKMNGVTTSSTYNGSIQSGQNFYIWGKNASGSSVERGYGYKLYYLKLYDNGVLKRNLIPCFRNSDNIVGLYDTVNSTFYTNSGSGTFGQGIIAGVSQVATLNDIPSTSNFVTLSGTQTITGKKTFSSGLGLSGTTFSLGCSDFADEFAYGTGQFLVDSINDNLLISVNDEDGTLEFPNGFKVTGAPWEIGRDNLVDEFAYGSGSFLVDDVNENTLIEVNNTTGDLKFPNGATAGYIKLSSQSDSSSDGSDGMLENIEDELWFNGDVVGGSRGTQLYKHELLFNEGKQQCRLIVITTQSGNFYWANGWYYIIPNAVACWWYAEGGNYDSGLLVSTAGNGFPYYKRGIVYWSGTTNAWSYVKFSDHIDDFTSETITAL